MSETYEWLVKYDGKTFGPFRTEQEAHNWAEHARWHEQHREDPYVTRR